MTHSKYKSGQMGRLSLVVTLLLMVGLALEGAAGQSLTAGRLLSRDEARRLGLERAWFAQVQLDRARHKVERAILVGDRLTVLTSAGVVHEFDALTGETLWVTPVGSADYPSLGPAANDKYVAVVNGSTLYVLRNKDGKPVLDRRVGGGAGAAPAVADDYIFVPLIGGRVEGYPLNQGTEEPRTPWYYQSYGRAMVAPLATRESFAWSTNMGHFYVGDSQAPAVRFRLESRRDIVAPPAYHHPLFYVGTTGGDLFAVHDTSGLRKWKFSTGYPIIRAPAAVGDRVYVTTEEPVMHCVDAKTGHGLWEAMNLTQFAAASKERVYGIDDLDALLVMDANTGAVLDRMPTNGTATALVNDQTDRLYLVTDSGLIQCLHEISAKVPLRHNPPPEAEKPTEPPAETTPSSQRATIEEATPPSEEEATTPAEDDTENPFLDDTEDEATDEPADTPEAENPFGVDDENPFGT